MVQPDTIVARATPPGMGAVAVVRMSGPAALGILGELTVNPDGTAPFEPRRATLATLADPATGAPIDRCLVTVFPGPASYTGEDLVEFSTHGGYLVPASVVEACVARGARSAEPGEFTQRAFLHGKIDLTQAEAVADLIGARAPRAAESALQQLDRGLGLRVSQLREGLVSLQAHLVQHLDFPEEDEAPLGVGEVAAEARELAGGLSALMATAPSGQLLREGALTVLAGHPNSGKSSLFNALLGRERAIVTEEAGTTRDALESTVAIDGFPFRLIDTAGIRDGAGRVEQMGIEVARRYLAEADLVLYCRDSGRSPVPGEIPFLEGLSCPVLVLGTKVDLVDAGGPQPGEAASPDW
ncbi:MAG: tRNA uridine-5-carboxymethylaminomethyl(34) synthesis GTPase MnmE, partial [Gemmatimonadetes bacterium]|nr:tRNA uridine-5-carboxymethylaminomethyl(34) synthesis GTPase MnmE [Gemmatimonadota bacterium]